MSSSRGRGADDPNTEGRARAASMVPPTPIGALEAQIQNLMQTKGDMRTLRAHVAGLEEMLEELTNTNRSLQRELDRKDEVVERHARRAQAQQDQFHD